jgi:hypothetical protein
MWPITASNCDQRSGDAWMPAMTFIRFVKPRILVIEPVNLCGSRKYTPRLGFECRSSSARSTLLARPFGLSAGQHGS